MGHFYFVRHGQTVWNVENKICGAADIALTERGNNDRHFARRLRGNRVNQNVALRATFCIRDHRKA